MKKIFLSFILSFLFVSIVFSKSPSSRNESEEMKNLKELTQVDLGLREISEIDQPTSTKKVLSYLSGGLILSLFSGGLLNEYRVFTHDWLILSSVIGASGGLLVGAVVEKSQLSLYLKKIKYLRRFQKILNQTSLDSTELHWRRKVSEIFITIHHIILGNQLRTSLERWLFLSAIERMLILNREASHEQISRELISSVLFDATQSIFTQALQQADAPIIKKSFRLREEILKVLVRLSIGDSARREYVSKLSERSLETLSEIEMNLRSDFIRKVVATREKFPEGGPLFQIRRNTKNFEEINFIYSVDYSSKEIDKFKKSTNGEEFQSLMPKGIWIRFPEISDVWSFYLPSRKIPTITKNTGVLEWSMRWPLSDNAEIQTLDASNSEAKVFQDLLPQSRFSSCLKVLRFGKGN
ncbi:MAG: hypothetical protein J0L93_08170 [Deltaproteobacteria bacterium]|nr:hypothetical protein [Deltaproteobacteria bacterium]